MTRVLRARLGVAAVFFINGFGFASWAPRLAEVKARLGASEGEFGLALFAVAIGALLAMPVTGALGTRHGSRTVTAISFVLFLLVPIPWALAPSLWTLALGFLAIGATAGALDVAMNAQAVEVERVRDRPILSSFHAMFSLGGMSGALVAGGIVALKIPLVTHLALVAIIALPVGILSCRAMLVETAPPAGGPSFALPTRGLLPIGVIAFCALLAEGAIADWSAIYVTESLSSEGTLAAIAFAAFQAAMASGRFLGDALIARFGGVAVARTGGLLAALGLGVALLIGHPVAAIAGFALVGLGISSTFPITISVAAARGEMPPGHAVAAIATLGYTAFLLGPPTIGTLAEATSLPIALGTLPFLCLAIATLSERLRTAPKKV